MKPELRERVIQLLERYQVESWCGVDAITIPPYIGCAECGAQGEDDDRPGMPCRPDCELAAVLKDLRNEQ